MMLAKELQDRGHTVRFLGHASQVGAFAAAGLPFRPYPTAGAFKVESSPLRLLHMVKGLFQLVAGSAMARDVAAELAARSADVVVVDCALFGVMEGLRRSGRDYVVLEHTFDSFLHTALQPLDVILRLRGIRALELLDSGHPTIAATLPEFDPRQASAVHIGPVVRAVQARPESPTVLISLSTAAFPGLAHLWQRTLDAVGSLPVRGIATLGPAMDPARLRVPANVEVCPWLPHEDVMPNVSVVVGHGGHGTTMAALAHGVPVLVLPLSTMSDQPWVGRTVERAGVGMALSRRSSSERIRAAVERLMGEGPHRGAAERIGERIRALDGRTKGADLLEAVASGGWASK